MTICAFFSVRSPGSRSAKRLLREIGHGAGVFDEFFEGGHDGGAGEQFAEEVDLAAQLIVGNWFDEFLGGCARHGIVFGDLRGCGAGDSQGFALARKLRYQAHSLCASSVNGSSREKQVAYESITEIALQPRDAAE